MRLREIPPDQQMQPAPKGLFMAHHYQDGLQERALAAFLAEHHHLIRGTVVDLGCGDRRYRSWLGPGLEHYVGVDVDPAARPDVVSSMTELSLDDDSADTVVCLRALSAVDAPWRAMSEAARVLRPGGYLLLVSSQAWRWGQEDDYFRFTPNGLEALANQAGLDPLVARPHGGLFAYLGAKSATYSGELLARSRLGRRIAPALTRSIEGTAAWLDSRVHYHRDPLQVELVARKP